MFSRPETGIAMSETQQNVATPEAPANPLLMPWTTPFETPPFAEILPEHFLPAVERAFADQPAEVDAITHDPATPDFANPITALERSGKLLSKVSAVFYDLVSAHSNPAILEIDKEVSPRMARHWNPIMMNAVLFGRIVLLHENRATLGLTAEQMRLLERTYTRFQRAGAGLSDEAKKRMAEINERLAHLGTSFSHHLLGDEQEWSMELGEDDRTGLPDSFVAAAKAAAEERGMAGKAILTLSRSSVEPFLKSSDRRDLREKALSGARPYDRGRLQLRHPAVRRHLRRAQGYPGLASRCPGLGGERPRRQSQSPVLRRLLRKALKTLRRLDDLAARPAKARRRDCASGHQCLQLRQGRRRPALAAVAGRGPDAVPRVRPRPARHAVGCDLPLAVRHLGVHRFRRAALAAL